MPYTEIRRDFDYVRTLIGDDAVDDVFAGGKAVINGGGANGVPRGHGIGRIWHKVTDGVWHATPETSVAWADIAWFGPFYSRREAAMWLLAMSTPHPRLCPSCGAPVLVGNPPIRPLFNRDGSAHSCAGW